MTPEQLESTARGKMAWGICCALHSHLPEDKRPQGWADLSDVQIERMLAAADFVLNEERREDVTQFLDGCVCLSNSIGPLFGAGWNSCIDMLRTRLPEFIGTLRTQSSETAKKEN